MPFKFCKKMIDDDEWVSGEGMGVLIFNVGFTSGLANTVKLVLAKNTTPVQHDK